MARNAANPEQVKTDARLAREAEELLRASLEAVMGTLAGRLVMWELLSRAGVYGSIWSPNSEIHYKAGRQDYGHELIALLLETNEGLYELMEREARARAKKASTTQAAVETPRAVTQETERNGNN